MLDYAAKIVAPLQADLQTSGRPQIMWLVTLPLHPRAQAISAGDAPRELVALGKASPEVFGRVSYPRPTESPPTANHSPTPARGWPADY